MSRADQRILRWCGHVERMDEYRVARRGVYGYSGGWIFVRLKLDRMDGVKVVFGNRGVTVEAA